MGLFLRVTDNGPSQQLVRNQQVLGPSPSAGSIANLLFAKDLQLLRLFHAASKRQIMSPRSEQMFSGIGLSMTVLNARRDSPQSAFSGENSASLDTWPTRPDHRSSGDQLNPAQLLEYRRQRETRHLSRSTFWWVK